MDGLLTSDHPQSIFLRLQINKETAAVHRGPEGVQVAQKQIFNKVQMLLRLQNLKNSKAKKDLLFGVILMHRFPEENGINTQRLVEQLLEHNYQDLISQLLKEGHNTTF